MHLILMFSQFHRIIRTMAYEVGGIWLIFHAWSYSLALTEAVH